MSYRRKLIEVALPLEAINKASAHEKSIRHGHPSTLHLWWSRKPVAAARAVIFSQMVDDPSEYVNELLADPATQRAAESSYRMQLKAWELRKVTFDRASVAGISATANPDPGKMPTLEETAVNQERDRLFAIIEDLVQWDNTTNEKVLQQARVEIWRSWQRTCRNHADHPRAKEWFNPQKLPVFHDPFAGGGSLPLEAQRLGLEAYASDLNPVAVLINKAMIEIPPKFAGRPPVNPKSRTEQMLLPRKWCGAQGLAEDVRYYGHWMRDEVEKRIGQLYPKAEITAEMAIERPDLKKYVGQKLTVIAWIWARTVKSPNPAFAQVDVPLSTTFMLSMKEGKRTYVEPVIENGGYRFTVKVGEPKDALLAENGTKLSHGANFRCLMSGTPMAPDYIKAEGMAGRMGERLMAIVAEGERERIYLPPTEMMDTIARSAKPEWRPEGALVEDARAFTPILYGLTKWSDLFTHRQLAAITMLSDLVQEVREVIKRDELAAGLSADGMALINNSTSATTYTDAVAVYLAFAIDKSAVYWNNLCLWLNQPKNEIVGNLFSRQAISMAWAYAEANPLCDSGGNFDKQIDYVTKALEHSSNLVGKGYAKQADAASQQISSACVISTDPPYYDNIPYADLSDFFYVWLRHSQKTAFPELFSTLAVPKAEELVVTSYRHGSKENAEMFFLEGMTQAMHRLTEQAHPALPVTIYYAFKQAESDDEGIASTGWDTFLDALIRAGFAITGTWPMRTERTGRMRDNASNALASSIVLVCRKSQANALSITRREFIATLKAELPLALTHLQAGNIAPVDLAQAAIGPGMAVYTRYAKVLDAQGKPLSVRQALGLINQVLDEALAEQEGDFDADTRWALAWFEQSGFSDGEFGVAETLSKAKDTSVAGMVDAGILAASRGKVRLLKPAELPTDWDPAKDSRLTAWEMVHHLIRVLESGGESAAGGLALKLGALAETARELCYRLYTICERKKRNPEALSYNALVQSWPEITRLARESSQRRETQGTLF